ncbi:MAG: serine/threonine-protein phosphatase, partial [Bacteroidales bacterium]|nr:serine/threonine-protein phosphatase [Bacteroidales bacterium]
CSIRNNILSYAGANNPLWIIRKDSQTLEEFKPDKQPIGKFDYPVQYSTKMIELKPGDTVYIFSDGYVDQFGGIDNKKFKARNFRRLLLSIQNESMSRQKEILDETFEKWKGQLEQLDDVCIIGVRA